MALNEFIAAVPSVPSWSVLLVILITSLYIYLTWNFSYWKRQGVKGDKPWPLFGTMKNPFTETLDIQDMKMYRKYGRVFGIFDGRTPCLVVGDPKLMKTILVKDFNVFRNRRMIPLAKKDKIVNKCLPFLRDDKWKQLRTTLTPTFTIGKIKQMISLINECAREMENELTQYADKNITFDIRQCFSSFTLDVIASCAFGMKIDDKKDPNSEFMKHAYKILDTPPKSVFLAFLIPQLIEYLPAVFSRESLNYFENVLNDIILVRKRETSAKKDFLQLLLQLCEESKETLNNAEKENKENSNFVMTHDYAIAQAIIFLLAGFETTATSLTFAVYSIVQREDIQEQLIHEIDEVLKKHEGVISYESIAEMNYVEMVISETLRMYPPAVRHERICEEDNYELDGIVLKKGMMIVIPAYSMHHDEEFFPNPEDFNPERFSTDNISQINPFTYLPFGYGPRHCIGMRFGLMMMKIALVSLFREFRVKTCSETEIPYKRQIHSFILKPERVKLMVEKRTEE